MIEITAPSPGESIQQVVLAVWLAENGSLVEKDAEIAEIESDKATIVVFSPARGILHCLAGEGETVEVGSVIGTLEVTEEDPETGVAVPVQNAAHSLHLTPLAKSIAEKNSLPPESLLNLKKQRITSKDLKDLGKKEPAAPQTGGRGKRRVKMSPLRLKLSERLVSVKNETAMLTTFNEVDMSRVIEIRKENKESFLQKFGYNLSYLSFFVRACALSFPEFPELNAAIDGDEIVYYDYADICIAVDTPKGLLTPAIRNAQDLKPEEIEQHLRDFAARAKENRIHPEELRDGTFTITNGGTFGSLFSTPLVNPPQSAILGMHRIGERPVAVNGLIEIRPMMYLALSYDHRLIDGKESVGFVMKVKEFLEHPELLMDAETDKDKT